MRFLLLHLLFLVGLLFASAPARAGQGLIRDAEIENTLEKWAAPLIRAAGLAPESVKIILVQNPEVNAFVAGGQNIFLYTGLLEKSQTPDEIYGVIAHEVGHIAGGHLVRGQAVMENASYEVMLGTLLGLGVAVATGSGEAAAAISGAAQGIAQRNFLSFSRTQEAAADQAALRFLDRAGLNATGLLSFMRKLEDQELLPAAQQNEYVRTHPISRDRVEMIESGLAARPPEARPEQPAAREAHARMKAKLIGFTVPDQVAWLYPATDTSMAADYARAISDYRKNKVSAALARAETLLAREPKNPYFYELKGQMLYDFGRVAESVPVYARAAELAPRAPLIQLAYAQALTENEKATPEETRRAIGLLERLRLDESRNTRVYRLLATLYGRTKQEGVAQAMLAEEAFLKGHFVESRRLVEAALKQLPAEDRHRRSALDLKVQLDRRDKQKKGE